MIFIMLKRSHEITLRGSCEFTIEIFQHHTYEDNKNMLMIFKISTIRVMHSSEIKDINTLWNDLVLKSCLKHLDYENALF